MPLYKAIYQTEIGENTLYIWAPDKNHAGLSMILQGKVASKMTTPRIKIMEVASEKRMVFKRIG